MEHTGKALELAPAWRWWEARLRREAGGRALLAHELARVAILATRNAGRPGAAGPVLRALLELRRPARLTPRGLEPFREPAGAAILAGAAGRERSAVDVSAPKHSADPPGRIFPTAIGERPEPFGMRVFSGVDPCGVGGQFREVP